MARKTKHEALETRETILDAAETLFLQRGVSHTSLQDIAGVAAVTRGAIYWHFKDKAELFDAMMDRATMPLEEGMSLHAAAEPALTLAALRWGMVNVFYSTMHRERTRRVFEIAMRKVEYTGEMQPLQERKLAAHRDWRAQNRAAFERAIALGQLPPGLACESAAIALVALVDGLLHQWIMDPASFDLMVVGQSAVERFLDSLANSGAPLLPPLTDQERSRLGQEGFCQAPKSRPSP